MALAAAAVRRNALVAFSLVMLSAPHQSVAVSAGTYHVPLVASEGGAHSAGVLMRREGMSMSSGEASQPIFENGTYVAFSLDGTYISAALHEDLGHKTGFENVNKSDAATLGPMEVFQVVNLDGRSLLWNTWYGGYLTHNMTLTRGYGMDALDGWILSYCKWRIVRQYDALAIFDPMTGCSISYDRTFSCDSSKPFSLRLSAETVLLPPGFDVSLKSDQSGDWKFVSLHGASSSVSTSVSTTETFRVVANGKGQVSFRSASQDRTFLRMNRTGPDNAGTIDGSFVPGAEHSDVFQDFPKQDGSTFLFDVTVDSDGMLTFSHTFDHSDNDKVTLYMDIFDSEIRAAETATSFNVARMLLPIGAEVALSRRSWTPGAEDVRYVSAPSTDSVSNEAQHLSMQASLTSTEYFTVVDAGDDLVALRSVEQNRYILVHESNTSVYLSRETGTELPGDLGRFQPVYWGRGAISLYCPVNQRFLRQDGDKVRSTDWPTNTDNEFVASSSSNWTDPDEKQWFEIVPRVLETGPCVTPGTTSSAPDSTTESTITTSSAPDSTTESTITTSSAPDSTTASTITTSSAPDSTTASTITTSSAPDSTTASTITTSSAPDSTTASTITTSSAPDTTTESTTVTVSTTFAFTTTTDTPYACVMPGETTLPPCPGQGTDAKLRATANQPGEAAPKADIATATPSIVGTSSEMGSSAAWTLFGMMTCSLLLIHLLKSSGSDTQGASFNALSQAMAFFTAVLLFHFAKNLSMLLVNLFGGSTGQTEGLLELGAESAGSQGMANDLCSFSGFAAAAPTTAPDSVSQLMGFLRFLLSFIVFEVLLRRFRADAVKMASISLCGTSFLGFMAADTFGTFQEAAPWRNHAGLSFLYCFIIAVSWAIFKVLCTVARQKVVERYDQNDPSGEIWKRQSARAEDLVFGITMGLLVTQAIRFALVGYIADFDGLQQDAPGWQTHLLLLFSVLFAATFLLMPLLPLHFRENAAFRPTQLAFAMCMSWSLLFWGKLWSFRSIANPATESSFMVAQVAVAMISTLFNFSAWQILGRLRARFATWLNTETADALGQGFVFVMALSWESVVMTAVAVSNRRLASEKSRLVATMLMCGLLVLLVAPVWYMHVLPKALSLAPKDDEPAPPAEGGKEAAPTEDSVPLASAMGSVTESVVDTSAADEANEASGGN